MVNAETELVPFRRRRNLSLIVPLYGLVEALLQTGFIRSFSDLCNNAASNRTYFDCPANSRA
jgi:hypothetical protein